MKLESDQSGTTLVEAVITMFIISVLLLVASTLTIASWRLYTRTQQRTQAIAQAESILTVITADLRSADGWLRMCESDLQNPDTVFTKDGQTSGSAIWLTTGTGEWMLLDAGALPATITENGALEASSGGTIHRRYFFADETTTPPGCIWKEGGEYSAHSCSRVGDSSFLASLYFAVSTSTQTEGEGTQVRAVAVSVTLQDEQGHVLSKRETVVSLPTAPLLVVHQGE